jgi:hypothetical protein
MADWLIGLKYTRDSLKNNRQFFDFFFQNVSQLFSHPNFKDCLGFFLDIENGTELPNDPVFFQKALCLLKIRLMNEVSYAFLQCDLISPSPVSLDTILSTIDIYIDTYQAVASQPHDREWNRGLEQLLIAMKMCPELFDRFFKEKSKHLSHRNYAAFLTNLNRIPLMLIPVNSGRLISMLLLASLKTQLKIRRYLKPLKAYFNKLLNRTRRE